MLSFDEAQNRRVSSSKIAVEELTRSAGRLLQETRTDRYKVVIEGKVSAINTVRRIITAIYTDLSEKDKLWARKKVEELTSSAWNVYLSVLTILEDAIEDEFDDTRLKAISEGKDKAFEQAESILDSIRELHRALSDEDDLTLGVNGAVKGKRAIESRAKSLRQESKPRQTRVR